MTTLAKAAQAVLDRWDSPACDFAASWIPKQSNYYEETV